MLSHTYRIEIHRTVMIYASSVDLLILLHWYLSIHTAKRFEGNKMEKKSKIVKKVLKSVSLPHISSFLFLGYWHFLYLKYNNMWERFPRSIKKAQLLWERNPKFNKINQNSSYCKGRRYKSTILYCCMLLYCIVLLLTLMVNCMLSVYLLCLIWLCIILYVLYWFIWFVI